MITCFILFAHILAYAEEKIPAPEFPHFLYTQPFSIQLAPASVLIDTVQETIEEQTPNIGSELHYSFTIPKEHLETMTDTEIDLLTLKTLLSIRSQKNITYYSNSRQTYRTFIKDIYTAVSKDDKTPIADIVPSTLQPSMNTTIFKYDSSFGKGLFSYDIMYKDSHEFLISIKNLEHVFYNIFILIASPKTLLNNILIQRKENTFTIYAVSYSNISMPFEGIRLRATKSLLYRMFALVKWFETEITATLQQSYTANTEY